MRINFFYIICFFCFLSSFDKLTILGFSHTSIGWIFPLFLSLFFLFFKKSVFLDFPVRAWFPWILYVMLSMIFSFTLSAFQRFIMLISPVLIGIVFSNFNFCYLDLKKINLGLKFLAVGLFLLKVTSFITNFNVNEPGLVMTASLLCCYFFVQGIYSDSKNFIFYIIVLLIPVIGVNRMAILACLIPAILFLKSSNLVQKIILGLFFIFISLQVFKSDSFQGKMFYSGSGNFSSFIYNIEDVRTHGRLVMWVPMMDKIPDSLLLGHGFDSSTEFIQNYISWITHPHNDYLRILFDLGIMGLFLFFIAYFFSIRKILFYRYRVNDTVSNFIVFLTLSFFVFFILMITGNPIYYVNYYGNLQFSLYGVLLSVLRNEKKSIIYS